MTGTQTRIFLNDNIIYHDSQRGITRYFRAVADGIIAHFGSETTICSPEFRDYGPARHIPSIRLPRMRMRLHNLIASTAAYLERPAIFFSPFHPYYGEVRTLAAEVFTIYDMIYELFPQYFPPQGHTKKVIMKKRQCMERASALIAISENTAKDILTCYPHLDANKIFVTHLGVSSFFFESVNQQHRNPAPPFFLYVGLREQYKNFPRLLMAFGQSGLAKTFDLRVISPIESGFTPQEREIIIKYRLQDKVQLLAAVDETALREHYASAVAFVYPSEYEGFGLPILEAMASGTLVATSNTSSMPEVGGDAAFYFDPHNEEAIADCLRRIAYLSDQERRERILQGGVRAKTFTWARCQQQTVEVLQSLL